MSDRQLRSRAAIATALVTVFSVPATAQQDTTQQIDELEEIVVVGTQIRGVDPVGSDPIQISREEATLTGLASTADILRRLPQNQTRVGGDVAFQGGTGNQGYNGAQVDGINLRGLGSSATLILVDGRRVVGGGAASTLTDANQIPVRALERLEVLVDGASAVYGSDAVAGVVNFVTRRDFDGVEVTLRADDQSGGDQFGGTLLVGKTWDNGNILGWYERLDRDGFTSGKIPRLRQDLRPLGGPDMRINSDNASVGFSPNIITQFLGPNTDIPRALTYTYFGVPAGDGTGLTGADLAFNQPNLVDGSDYQEWTGEQTVDRFALYLNQSVTSNVELFGSLTYTDRETVTEYPAPTIRIPLAGTPYFIADLPPDQVVQYSTLKDGRNRTFSGAAETTGAVVGIRADFSGDWEAEAFFNYGRNEQCDSCITGTINSEALATQVFLGNINPLSSVPLTDAQAASVYGDSTFESRTTLEQFVARFNGPLFDLPAGPMRAAVGAEFRTETNANRNTSMSGPTNAPMQLSTYGSSEYDRDISSLFVELNMPLAERLTLSAALRYDDYSDFGDTTNPKLGVTWDVTDKFTLQGTWGTSFRAPTVTDINPAAVASGTATPAPNWDPDIVNGFLPAGIIGPFGLTNAALMLGSNPDLVAEEADTWSITASFAHEGFDLSLTYWDITYDDQIVFPGTLVYLAATPADVPANGGNYQGWESYIIPVNNPATCDNSDISTADPVLQPFLESLNLDFVAGGGAFSRGSTLTNNFCQVNVILDSRIQNVGEVHKTGIDFSVGYSTEIGNADLITQLALTHFLSNDIVVAPGESEVSEIGSLGDGPSVFEWSGTAGATVLWNGFDASLVARYLSSMLATGQLQANGLPGGPDRNISPYTQLDLTLGYGADLDESRFLEEWRLQLAVTNITDEYPDFFAPGDQASAWDLKYGMPFGTTYSLQLTATF